MAKHVRMSMITYRERPKETPILWAWREGTKDEIRESAEELLRGLREEGFKRAAVYVDGHRINLPKSTSEEA